MSVSARKIACRQSSTQYKQQRRTRKKVDELLALYKPGVVSPAKNNSQGEADETVFDCPLNSAADFARLGEDTAKALAAGADSCILTSWITTMFPI